MMSKPRRILHVSRSGSIGGAERVMLTLLGGLSDRGFQPVLTCPQHGGLAAEAMARGITVVPAPLSRMRVRADPRALLALPSALWRGNKSVNEICNRVGISIAHVHHPVGALYCERATHKRAIPLLLHLHDGLPLSMTYAAALRRAASKATEIVCVSQAAAAVLPAAGIRRRPEIVANGLDPQFLRDATAVDLGREGPHIAVFGALEPRKGQDIFLQACQLVAAALPSACFWLVGAAPDKRYEAQLRTLADHQSLRGRVAFAGHQKDMNAYLRAMNLVVLPSRSHETLGMVLLEAMACGIPVVATRIGGIPEAVRDGQTGILVPPENPALLASAILAALEHPWPAMIEAARRDIRERYSAEQFCDRMAMIYHRMLGGDANAAGIAR